MWKRQPPQLRRPAPRPQAILAGRIAQVDRTFIRSEYPNRWRGRVSHVHKFDAKPVRSETPCQLDEHPRFRESCRKRLPRSKDKLDPRVNQGIADGEIKGDPLTEYHLSNNRRRARHSFPPTSYTVISSHVTPPSVQSRAGPGGSAGCSTGRRPSGTRPTSDGTGRTRV